MESQAAPSLSTADHGRPATSSWFAGFAGRLALATSVLVVAVCGSQSWLLARHDLDHVQGYLEDRGRSLATQLARDAARALAEGDVDGVQRLVDQARAASDVVYARAVERRGLLVAAAGQPPARSPRVATGPGAGVVGSVADDGDVREFRAPIVALAEPVTPAVAAGTVSVGVSFESLHALRRRRVASGIVFAALSALVGILGAGLLARALTRPLRALVAAVDRISRGDFTARVAAGARDEVGTLAAAFNAMAGNLELSRAALEEKVHELERADHLKSEFLATVSHELRTPLNVILGYTEMLAEGGAGPVTPAQADLIATIERYSRNQLELITSVLDFARLSSGKVSVNVERFALAPLLAEIVTHRRARLPRTGIELTVAVDGELPEVQTDRVKLQEIVTNLVDNAVKFTEAGAVAVRARLDRPGWFAIEVADSGPGIPAAERDAVFDAFRQLGASSTRGTGGVGLGLSIVRQLTEALGGSVSVTSRLGEGAVFHVLLPCVVPVAAVGMPTAAEALDAAARNTAVVPLRARRGERRAPRHVRSPKA